MDTTDHERAAGPADIEKRILEELIYERVRVSVNLCQLVLFEQDLDKSILRALRACSGTKDERESLARTYMDSAWRRVEREWKTLRDQVGMDELGHGEEDTVEDDVVMDGMGLAGL